MANTESPAPFVWEDKPLEEMGLVQLVERLGAAIEKRRAAVAVQAELPASATPAQALRAASDAPSAPNVMTIPTDEPVEAMAANSNTTDVAAEEIAPIELVTEHEDELVSTPPPPETREAVIDQPGFAALEPGIAVDLAKEEEETGEGEEENEEEGDYSSLLRLRKPFPQTSPEIIRTSDEPADKEENDRALREALLNLQRMSSAG